MADTSQQWAIMEKVKAAFRELRKEGIQAKVNPADCMTCSLATFSGPKGVYFHSQDVQHFRGTGELAIRYFDNQGDARQLGRRIVDVFREHGLATKWSGNAGEVILVEGTAA